MYGPSLIGFEADLTIDGWQQVPRRFNEPLVVNVTNLLNENLVPVRKTVQVLEILCHDKARWSDLQAQRY